MKKSVAFLPQENQDDLKEIVSLIREKIPGCEMIILFGSYAKGKFVRYDERVEFGVPTTFRSDYDIWVIHSSTDSNKVRRKIGEVEKLYYRKPHPYKIPLQIIHDNIKKVNRDLDEGRYFYTELKRDGILLYDSGNYKLARRRKLRFEEIKRHAERYLEEKYTQAAQDFFKYAKIAYTNKDYKMGAFFLHQSCENLFNTISLVFTLKSDKEHNLKKLFDATHSFVPEMHLVFPFDSQEEKDLFDLLVRSYIESRYDPAFKISKEELDKLTIKVEQFAEITKAACLKQIEYYDGKIRKRTE